MLEAAKDVRKRAKSPSPKPRVHSPGSNLDFVRSLPPEVDSRYHRMGHCGMWSCYKLLAQRDVPELGPEREPVDVQVHGTCHPMVTLGEKGGPQVKGVGQFRAMAKPLLSVSKLGENGWTVTFGPQGSFLVRGSKKVPVTLTGGVFKVAMDFPSQRGKRRKSCGTHRQPRQWR